MVDKAAHTPVSTLKMRSLPFLRASTPLYDLLHLFEVGRCHMAVLTGPLPAKHAECSPDIAANAPSAEGLPQLDPIHVHAQWQRQQQDQQHQLDGGQGHDRCWQPEMEARPAHLISTEHHAMALEQVLRTVLCCAVLCCAVLCCAVLCYAVLCGAVLCCAVPCTHCFVLSLAALRTMLMLSHTAF